MIIRVRAKTRGGEIGQLSVSKNLVTKDVNGKLANPTSHDGT